MEQRTKYIVKTAAACMPSSCWGTYRRVAVLEIEADRSDVAMISGRARGVVSVVATWERQHCGTTDRDAYSRAVRAARDLVETLTAFDAVVEGCRAMAVAS